ncbi:hypothetical protein LSTR_LSTR010356 [Laodelphax striatellus]|uniref:Uncharacterized protein n=1 Tax=Laodelphax striatellus TaxID=195883 RepID=A0A482WK17_LAOST|nr:hypothetical protein LSTR_LSTR010356 [Laodelphax striatellus]
MNRLWVNWLQAFCSCMCIGHFAFSQYEVGFHVLTVECRLPSRRSDGEGELGHAQCSSRVRIATAHASVSFGGGPSSQSPRSDQSRSAPRRSVSQSTQLLCCKKVFVRECVIGEKRRECRMEEDRVVVVTKGGGGGGGRKRIMMTMAAAVVVALLLTCTESQAAWQDNIRPKVYVHLEQTVGSSCFGKKAKMMVKKEGEGVLWKGDGWRGKEGDRGEGG